MGYLITKDNKRLGVDQKIPISDNVIYGRPGLFNQQRLCTKKISNFDTLTFKSIIQEVNYGYVQHIVLDCIDIHCLERKQILHSDKNI
jgi:hypothetical protein